MRVPTGYCYIETGEGDLRFIPQPGPKPFALYAEFSRDHIANSPSLGRLCSPVTEAMYEAAEAEGGV